MARVTAKMREGQKNKPQEPDKPDKKEKRTVQWLGWEEVSRLFPVGGLTDKQFVCFCYIVNYILQRGYAPTIRDIGQHMHISSPNGVVGHLTALQKKGLIYRGSKESRGMRVVGMRFVPCVSGPDGKVTPLAEYANKPQGEVPVKPREEPEMSSYGMPKQHPKMPDYAEMEDSE
jgi:hypothetical protein